MAYLPTKISNLVFNKSGGLPIEISPLTLMGLIEEQGIFNEGINRKSTSNIKAILIVLNY